MLCRKAGIFRFAFLPHGCFGTEGSMLQDIFTRILEMSMVGCYSILIVLAVRGLLLKCERKYSYYLWFIVFLNLCVPFSLESAFSLIPRQVAEFTLGEKPASVENGGLTGGMEENGQSAGKGKTGPALTGGTQNPAWQPQTYIVTPEQYERNDSSDNSYRGAWSAGRIAAIVWLAGAAAVLGVNGAGYWKLLRTIRRGRLLSEDTEKRIRVVDSVQSAFLCGLIRPYIYLPAGLEGEEGIYVIAHEQYHRKRKDYLLKPLVLCVTALHWFNPLAWLALFFFCQDMEVSCDEKVLDRTTGQVRKQYAASLLKFAARQSGFLVTSLNFGKPALESRIRNVLKAKKKNLLITCIAVAGVLAVTLGLALRPKAAGDRQGENPGGDPGYVAETGPMENNSMESNSMENNSMENSSAENDSSAGGPEGSGDTEGGSTAGLPASQEGTEKEEDDIWWWERKVIGEPCDPAEAGFDLSHVILADDEKKFSDMWPLHEQSAQDLFLLGKTDSYTLYIKGDMTEMLLEKDGHYARINCDAGNRRGPEVKEADFDGDGSTELYINVYLFYGTGTSIDTLFVADQDKNGELTVYQYLQKEYEEILNSHLSCRQTQKGTQAMVDGADVGEPMFADRETGDFYDALYAGDIVYFTAEDGKIAIQADIGFYNNEWGGGVLGYNTGSIRAAVRYTDGGGFSLADITPDQGGYDPDAPSVPTNDYADAFVSFEYPKGWSYTQEQGEDGRYISFLDASDNPVFWLEQGEAWRVNLEDTKEEYQKQLEEEYQTGRITGFRDMNVIEVTKEKLGGFDANRILYEYYTGEGKEAQRHLLVRYITVVDYAFFRLTFEASNEEIVTIRDSVDFTAKE